MLSDPQTLTIDGISTDLPSISVSPTETLYQSSDGKLRLRVSYTTDKAKTRYLVRVEEDAISADPISAVNAKKTCAVYVVIDQPLFGFADTRVRDITVSLKDWLTSANILKVLGNQH